MSLPRIEGYTVLRAIGAGGMAELFLAERSGVEGARRRVVLKRILPGFARDPQFRDLFVHEARVAMQLSHANVVQVYDFFEADDTYVLEMEPIDGCDLRRALADGPLALAAAVYVAVEVLRGLDYAHRRASADGSPLDIVHRDVSPGNILLSREGEVKLTDFGLARSREKLVRSSAGVKGTFAFMAPEQACGEPVDARADVFAAGAVLYAALAGKSPFDADGPLATLERVRAAAVAPLGIDAKLDEILACAMAREPGARFASAAEFREALESFAHERGLRLGPRAIADRVPAPAAPVEAIVSARTEPSAESAPRVVADLSEPPPEAARPITQAVPSRKARRSRAAIAAPLALIACAAVAVLAWRASRSSNAAPAPIASAPIASAPIASAPIAVVAKDPQADPPPAPIPPSPTVASAPTASPPPPRAPRSAYLTVSADPWAFVSVDGKRRGTTPVKELALAPGPHEVTLENPPLGASRSRVVRLAAGEHKTVVEHLTGGAP